MNLINEIHKIEGDSLLEKILSYCEIHEINPQELGDIISDIDQFKEDIWLDCVKNNIVQDDTIKHKLNKEMEEW
jgi:hypothetical protein